MPKKLKKREEINRTSALFRAMARLNDEFPPKTITLQGGLKVKHVLMDYAYLRRLAEIADEEYAKIQ